MVRFLFAVITTVLFFAVPAKADFFVQIKDASPTTYAPGGTGVLEVWGSHNEGAAITLNGWRLSFDLSTSGVWDLLNTTATIDNSSPSNAFTGSSIQYYTDPSWSPNNYDFAFETVSPGSFSMNSNQSYKLADINFKISNLAAQGTYNLNFVAAALDSLVALPIVTQDVNNVAYNGSQQYVSPTSSPKLLGNAIAGFQGQFIVAVPEPSSLAFVGLATFCLGLFRRRK